MAEYCVRTGVDANQTLMMLVPEAYQNHPTLLRKYPEVIFLPHTLHKEAEHQSMLSALLLRCFCADWQADT